MEILKNILKLSVLTLCIGGTASGIDIVEAVSKGDIELVKKMLNEGVDVNVMDKYGWTPLMSAVASCNLEMTKLLLDSGAKVTIKDTKGFTAYNYVCKVRKTANEKVRQEIILLLDDVRSKEHPSE